MACLEAKQNWFLKLSPELIHKIMEELSGEDAISLGLADKHLFKAVGCHQAYWNQQIKPMLISG